MRYIVREGDVHPLPATEEELENLGCYQDNYGGDWILLTAQDEDDALAQAMAYDNHCHPAQIEMMLFAAVYPELWGDDFLKKLIGQEQL